jgi:hypothetical protein
MTVTDFDISKFKEIIEGDGFQLEALKEAFSTNINCTTHNCPVKIIDKQIQLIKCCNLWFDNWLSSELWVRVRAEIDGCNVKNARILPGNKSYIAWYSPRSYVTTVNTVVTSVIPAPASGCSDCCANALCVEFDVSFSSKVWFGEDIMGAAIIKICGNDVNIDVIV